MAGREPTARSRIPLVTGPKSRTLNPATAVMEAGEWDAIRARRCPAESAAGQVEIRVRPEPRGDAQASLEIDTNPPCGSARLRAPLVADIHELTLQVESPSGQRDRPPVPRVTQPQLGADRARQDATSPRPRRNRVPRIVGVKSACDVEIGRCGSGHSEREIRLRADDAAPLDSCARGVEPIAHLEPEQIPSQAQLHAQPVGQLDLLAPPSVYRRLPHGGNHDRPSSRPLTLVIQRHVHEIVSGAAPTLQRPARLPSCAARE